MKKKSPLFAQNMQNIYWKMKKMFEYSKIDKDVYFIMFLWLSLSMLAGRQLGSKLAAPSFIKQIYSTYEKFMTPEDYNFFCFNVIFIISLAPFFAYLICKKTNYLFHVLRKICFFLLGLSFFILTALSLINLSKNNNSRGLAGLIKSLLEFGEAGATLFFFIMLSFSVITMILAATAKKSIRDQST